jgi:ubiquinone biosynthesis protein
MIDAPGDMRLVLRRFAEGDLGRFQAPTVEALGGHVSRNLERFLGAILSAALMVAGALLVSANKKKYYYLALSIRRGHGSFKE